MSDVDRDIMVKRQFAHRNKQGLCQVLTNIQERLVNSGGWMPRLDFVVYLAKKNKCKLVW